MARSSDVKPAKRPNLLRDVLEPRNAGLELRDLRDDVDELKRR